MGKTVINGRSIVAPQDTMRVSELKELAGIPERDVLYDKQGQVLQNEQQVPTADAEYGAVTDWVRGC